MVLPGSISPSPSKSNIGLLAGILTGVAAVGGGIAAAVVIGRRPRPGPQLGRGRRCPPCGR